VAAHGLAAAISVRILVLGVSSSTKAFSHGSENYVQIQVDFPLRNVFQVTLSRGENIFSSYLVTHDMQSVHMYIHKGQVTLLMIDLKRLQVADKRTTSLISKYETTFRMISSGRQHCKDGLLHRLEAITCKLIEQM
jgi:hypothetical protein